MTMSENAIYRFRHIARVVLEAETPLAVGSGEKDIMTDALVATDANGLPYIPGTALAGVLRHALTEDVAKEFFGYDKNGGMGSEIIFSDAKMIGKEGTAVDGLQTIDFNDGNNDAGGNNGGNNGTGGDEENTGFYNYFLRLPIRQHVRIGHRGVAEQGGKFDEQVVFKGTRFCFEVELLAKEAEKEPGKSGASENFNNVLAQLGSKTFRIGGGTRKGFGKMKVVSCKSRLYDLKKPNDLGAYLKHSADLSVPIEPCEGFENHPVDSLEDGKWTCYKLTLEPADFFLMGSGVGDEDVDMTAVKATVITWDEAGKPKFETEKTLIPATSIKGALAHRVAYHYNKLKGIYSDKLGNEKPDNFVGSKNFAVKTLFGEAADNGGGQRGNVIFSDIIEGKIFSDIIEGEAVARIFNHVSIDRFTGGAIDGALFAEKPVYGKGRTYKTELLVRYPDKAVQPDKTDPEGQQAPEEASLDPAEVQQALEEALLDLAEGLLPLGGGVNRGHGVFTGTVERVDKEGGEPTTTTLTRNNINHTNTI